MNDTAPLELVRLGALMRRTSGSPDVRIGLIDGPIALDHPDLSAENIHELPGSLNGTCTSANSIACTHGTFVAGILLARRGSDAPALCPGCTLLLRPIFSETAEPDGSLPHATPEELAAAIVDCVNAGAHVINVSAAVVEASARDERFLKSALDYAATRAVVVVVAAGNQGMVGGSAIIQHPSVIPVVACDGRGWPMADSNLGSSIGRRGLSAPGENIRSLSAKGALQSSGGTSAAAAFVTGTIALLWSVFPSASSTMVKLALLQAGGVRRKTVAPPVMNASAAYGILADAHAAAGAR